jgi:hypothetical protein
MAIGMIPEKSYNLYARERTTADVVRLRRIGGDMR